VALSLTPFGLRSDLLSSGTNRTSCGPACYCGHDFGVPFCAVLVPPSVPVALVSLWTSARFPMVLSVVLPTGRYLQPYFFPGPSPAGLLTQGFV